MLSGASFQVFDRYKDAKDHAFSNNVVSEEDKDVYQATFVDLREAAEQAIAVEPFATWFKVWSARFSRYSTPCGPINTVALVVGIAATGADPKRKPPPQYRNGGVEWRGDSRSLKNRILQIPRKHQRPALGDCGPC